MHTRAPSAELLLYVLNKLAQTPGVCVLFGMAWSFEFFLDLRDLLILICYTAFDVAFDMSLDCEAPTRSC